MYDISGGMCQQFAHILRGEPHVKHGVCSVERDRSSISLNILGRPSRSALHSMWSFESIDQHGKALNLGETALLQEEVYPYVWHLQRNGIIVTALHNHWLMESPRLIYAHFASIEEPLSFANKAAEAFRVLKQ